MTDTYTIRPALESDSKKIEALIDLVGINPTGLSWTRFLVGVDFRGEVIACGQVKPHGQDVLELASIAVHPEHRGKGLSRKIIQRLLDENPRPLYLMCMSHNAGLYKKFGFGELRDNQMPRYFLRIKKMFALADVFRKSGEELVVMKLE